MNLSITQEREFWEFFNAEIDLDDYRYKFLRQDIQRMKQGNQVIYDDTFFNIQNSGWILIIASEGFIVYGKNWSENQISEIKENLDLNRYTNYLMRGERLLIETLIKLFQCSNFILEQERIFYQAGSNITLTSPEVNIRLANQEDINILACMLQQYYHEEYEGKNDKNIQEMIEDIVYHVQRQSIYILENSQNRIVSFCTILMPDIGIMFTDSNQRNKGYGKLILSHCTELLLQFNEQAFLMTNKKNPSSNSTAISVGYESFYEYGYFRINNSLSNQLENDNLNA